MDINRIRKDFPILERKVNGKSLAYLDNAATSQKPVQVLAAMDKYWREYNANVHRGIHTLSVEATEAYEAARKNVARFVGVDDSSEIIFVRNATEAINLVAYSWGRLNISRGDEIVLTVAEHHSNFVVWQQLAIENGAVLKIVPIDENGEIDELAFKKALTKKTKLVTFFHVSNVLGTINDIHNLISIIHNLSPKAKILIDGAQAVPHMKVDISKIGCDFYVFTGHKMLGPTGIGVLWGRRELLEKMPPFLFGGEMISKVNFDRSSWNELPWKFEAGTPNIAGVIGLGAAVDYLQEIGMEKVREHEIELTEYALRRLLEIPGVTIIGPKSFSNRHSGKRVERAHPESDSGQALRLRSGHLKGSELHRTARMTKPPSLSSPRPPKEGPPLAEKRGSRFSIGSRMTRIPDQVGNDNNRRAGVVSFNVGKVHAHDVASILDSLGIAIRSGHHCAQPLMEFLGISSAARASFYLYNTIEEVDRLVEGILKVIKTFKLDQKSKIKYTKAYFK